MQLTLAKVGWQGTVTTFHSASARAAPLPRSRHVVRAQQQDDQPVQGFDSSNGHDFTFPCSTSFPPALAYDWRSFRARLVAMEQGRVDLAAQMHMRQDVRWAHPIAQPERGCLLVARRQALGMFTHSVVLVLEHDDATGTTGLILNMPTPLLISHLGMEEDIADAFGRSPLFIGGPLGKERLHILHGRRQVEGSMEVIEGVYIGGLENATEQVLRREAGAPEFVMLCGYAQWGPWQLQQELRNDTWWVVAASSTVVQDCLKEVSAWDPNTLHPMNSGEALKRQCWEGVLLEAGVDPQLTL